MQFIPVADPIASTNLSLFLTLALFGLLRLLTNELFSSETSSQILMPL